MDPDRQDEIRRLQTGAIGLIAVLLLVGLASTLVQGDKPDGTANGAVAGASAASAGSEPLVELGVQPDAGGAPAAKAPPAAPPAAAAAPPNVGGLPSSGGPASASPPSQPVPVGPDGTVPDLAPDPKAQRAARPN